jgi:ketosteroid isomerase-like protein
MKPPTPKEVINRWFEQVWNARDKSTIFAMMAEDAVAHLAGGAQACGIAQFSQFQETFLAAFPDLSVVSSDRSAMRRKHASLGGLRHA